MIELSEEKLAIIDRLIASNQLFALYNEPRSNEVHFVMQNSGEPALFSDLKDLNGKSGFVIAPFHLSDKYPAVLLREDRTTFPTIDEVNNLPLGKPHVVDIEVEQTSDELFSNYEACFSGYLEQLKKEHLVKIVLARHAGLKHSKESIARVYEKACNAYPNGFVYLVYTPQTGLWMGSTPEILLKGTGDAWRTVALAGTQTFHDGEIYWDEKNRVEQDLVVQYVKHQLNSFGITPTIEGPTNIKAGKLVHLFSTFDFALPDCNKLGDLLKLLHPTPAVCGLPKKEAYDFIVANEQQDRKYYAGFIGEINSSGPTTLYVNLRCMQITDACCVLYAGGGLLSTSSLLEEWNETVGKMDTMKSLFD